MELKTLYIIIAIIGGAIGIAVTINRTIKGVFANHFQKGYDQNTLDTTIKKVDNLACDDHRKEIEKLKTKGQNMNCQYHHDELTAMRTLLISKYPNDSVIFSRKHSPSRLNELGQMVFDEMEGALFLNENKTALFEWIDKMHPKTPLDVENLADAACVSISNDDAFNKIKRYIYNREAVTITKNGVETEYGINLNDVCYILSLPLRDMYLEEHPELLND